MYQMQQNLYEFHLPNLYGLFYLMALARVLCVVIHWAVNIVKWQ